MTRANAEQLQSVPWYAKAGAASSIVPIARFVTDYLFALKGGGYGCLFSLTGIDEESLTDQELEAQIRMVEGSLKSLPEGACLYQYTRVRSGFELPRRESYPHPVTESFVEDRLQFLRDKANFRRIDLHWCLTVEPAQAKAFAQKPTENSASNSRMLAELDKAATLLVGNLGSSLGLLRLNKEETFQFFSYLFNLEDWAERVPLMSDTGIDRQIVASIVAQAAKT